jgi:hypothetical protein
LEEKEDMVRASKVKNFESIENARSWWCLLPNTAWFIRNLLLPSFWTAAQISTVHTVLPWEAFLIFGIYKSDLNRTYKTFLRSFPHFWDPQIESQPYIQDFLEKLSSSLGSNYKSNPNRTYKTFLRRFHHLWDRFTNQISTIQVWLPLEFFINPEAHCWNHFHVFHKNVEITFMYFTDGSVHKTIAEITFMYFTKTLLKSLSCISQDQYWKHFHVFHLGRSPIRIIPTEKICVFFNTSIVFLYKTYYAKSKENEFSNAFAP